MRVSQGRRLWDGIEVGRVLVGVVSLEASGYREVKLFHFEATGILPLDVQTTGNNYSGGGCLGDIYEESASKMGTMVEE